MSPAVEGGGGMGVRDQVSQGGRARWQTPSGGKALAGVDLPHSFLHEQI